MPSKYQNLIQDTKLYLRQQKSHIFLNHLDPKTFKAPLPNMAQKKPAEPVILPPLEKAKEPREKKEAPKVKVPPQTEELKIKLEAPKKENDLLDDVRKDFIKLFPTLKLLKDPLPDEEARRIATSYRYKNQAAPITILDFNDKKEITQFLTEVATAISIYFHPCKLIDTSVIEKEKRWDALLSAPDLKLVIAPDYAIFQQKTLMTFYREVSQKMDCFLGDVPLFLLPDVSLYFKDPQLKRSLWKALTQKLSILS